MTTQTIYALSTPFFKSAIAIIRVSGQDAKKTLQLLTKKTDFVHAKAYVSDLFDSENNILDNAMVIYFKLGASYTGEELVEYHIHGSMAVIKDLLQELAKMPYLKMAEPGEFTRRALENGKLDLSQVEGIIDLINAQTSNQRKQSLKELKGITGKSYKIWYEELKEILALLEATLDFSDHEIDKALQEKIKNKIVLISKQIAIELNKSKSIRKLKNGISLAILGSPNVGKSSLINCLTNQDISIVSEMAGTTRDIVETSLDFEGFPINIADTAGIRDTKNKIELEGVHRALLKADSVDMKIIILDASDLLNSYSAMKNLIDENSIVVINKLDLNTKIDLADLQSYFLISLKNNLGITALKKVLVKKLEAITLINEDPIITQQRHVELITNCQLELKLALTNFDDPIITSFHVRNALTALGKIFSIVDIEEILDIIFSNMCIGK